MNWNELAVRMLLLLFFVLPGAAAVGGTAAGQYAAVAMAAAAPAAVGVAGLVNAVAGMTSGEYDLHRRKIDKIRAGQVQKEHSDPMVVKWAIELKAAHPAFTANQIAGRLNQMNGLTGGAVVTKWMVNSWLRANKATHETGTRRQVAARGRRLAARSRTIRRKRNGAVPLPVQNLVFDAVLARPSVRPDELVNLVHHHTSDVYTKKALADVRRKVSGTRKKTRSRAFKKSAQAQLAYRILFRTPIPTPDGGMQQIEAHHIISLDETYKSSKDMYRKYGYARGGLPARESLTIPDINISFSTLAALTIDGLVAFKTRWIAHGHGNTGVDTEKFLTDAVHVLVHPDRSSDEQLLQAWPKKNSVVILDNCT